MKGCYYVGFSLNRQYFYPLKQMMGTAIGLFGATFNKRSEFIYKTISHVESFFIRKVKWIKILNDKDNKSFIAILKNHIKAFYLDNINKQLMQNK